MANPKESIWGAPNTWIYSPNTTYGLTSTLSQTIHADRPKVAYFGAGTTAGYEGSLLRAINVSEKMTLNEYIDNSICPCGQDPTVSPFSKLAIFNENDDLSTTPRVVTITDNINWFFADKAVTAPYNNGFEYFKQYTRQGVTNEGLKFQQFAPKANSPANGSNVDMQMCPYTYYGLRSLFLSIEVHCMAKNATNPILNTQWRTLRAWQVNYSETEDIIGLRLYVRTCQSINSSTLELTYSNDKAISYGQQSFVCVTNPITINNDGTDTPTQMLSIYNKGQRCAYIFDITEQIYAWDSGNDSRTNRAVLPCWNYFDGQTVHTYYGIPSDPVRYYYYKIPYSESTYNKIMSIAALFGCFFTDRNVNVFPYDMLSEYAYLPIIDEHGVAHGEYTNGADNANNPLYSKSSIRDIDYNPDAPPVPVDPNTYSNVTGFNSLTSGATMTKRYVLDAANVEKLGDDLWTICGSLSSADFEYFDGKLKDEFLTTNPIDSIISLQRFPFEIPHIGSSKAPIKLGKSTVTAEGYTTLNPLNTIVFSGKDIFPRFGDCFLDYEPYTSYEVYVPFCGTTKIRAADILGHTLNIQMQIDLFTGSCTAYIMADQLVIETLNGSCAVEQTLSGTQTATMNANIFNGILNQKAADRQETTTLAKMLFPTGWIPTILNPVGGYEKIENAKTQSQIANYEITHVDVPPHKIGAASPLLGWCQEFDARIIIYYPEGDVIDSTIPPSLKDTAVQAFGRVKGFGTVSAGAVSTFHGYTQGSIKADNIPCTQSERERIKQAFESGVFLPYL